MSKEYDVSVLEFSELSRDAFCLRQLIATLKKKNKVINKEIRKRKKEMGD